MKVRVRFYVTGISPDTRRMYRKLRKHYDRNDLNLIMYGIVTGFDMARQSLEAASLGTTHVAVERRS
jgi:hypothetical protein